ncbi:MAG: hypothetical protein H3C49_08390 [Alphaproteobacteria bacterium]|nr:hypothetical protein [Alphaproteobacteria bacterium]
MKKALLILASIVSALVLYGVLTMYMNIRAYHVRGQVLHAFSVAPQSGAPPVLAGVGGVVWDYICVGSYEAKGIDVASAKWIAERARVKHVDSPRQDFSGFDIADEIYTEFAGSRHGLVFVSLQEKLLVGTVFPADVGLGGEGCVEAADAALVDTPKEKQSYVAKNYRRYFSLSGAKLK